MKKILIVEDDTFYRELYCSILQPLGYHILECQDGDRAIELALLENPHFIIMDWHLPNVDGLTAAKIIKSKIKDHFIFMMMVTGIEGKEAKVQSLDIFDDYLEKPFDKQILIAKIKRGFRIVEAFDEIKILYNRIKELLYDKESLIKTLDDERQSLEQKVKDRTLELHQNNSILLKRNEEIAQDLEISSRLQHSLIPQTPPCLDQYKISSFYQPVDRIGGDFYDFIQMRENKIGVILGDVSGHGIAAAFITSVVKTIISNYRMFLPNPSRFLDNINKNLVDKIYHYFVTAFYGVLDLERPHLLYSSAGHLPPLLYHHETKEVVELDASGTILGVCEDLEYGEKEHHLKKGDRILIFTDGIIEVFDEKREMFGYDKLKTIFKELAEVEAENFFDMLIEVVQHFAADSKFQDDVALILIEVL